MLFFTRIYSWILIGGILMGIALSPLSYKSAEAQKKLIKLSKKSLPQKNKRLTAIVIDANTGQILYEENAFSPRCPASTIKILTVYIVFSELKRGNLRLTDQLKISQHAAQQRPTKMGLKAGNTISVRDAILGSILKSGNDSAVVLAEAISGTEAKFARLMTQTAKKLGLTKTTCVNASGWPEDAHGFLLTKQISTAADLAKLSRAIMKDFPQYYNFFYAAKLVYRGTTFKNTNPLLNKKKGVDGLKTGYGGGPVGFNFASSEKRGNLRVIAVVMGARTPQERNQKASHLLDKGFEILKIKSGSPSKKQQGLPLKETPEVLQADDVFDLEDLQEIFEETTPPPFTQKDVSPEFEETLSSLLKEKSAQSFESKPQQKISQKNITPAPPKTKTPEKISEEEFSQDNLPFGKTEDLPSFETTINAALEATEEENTETPPPFSQKEKNKSLPQTNTKGQKKPLAKKTPQKVPFGKTRDLPSFSAALSEEQEISLKKNSETPKPVPQKELSPSSKKWSIQVAMLPTSSKAKEEGKRLTQAFPSFLKVNRLRILKTDKKGHKKSFSVRFLGFSKQEAKKACQTLTSQKKQCVVITP